MKNFESESVNYKTKTPTITENEQIINWENHKQIMVKDKTIKILTYIYSTLAFFPQNYELSYYGSEINELADF